MKPVYLHISWAIKFRAFGFTAGSYSDHRSILLPSAFSLAEALVHTPYSYNDHGVTITVSLSDTSS